MAAGLRERAGIFLSVLAHLMIAVFMVVLGHSTAHRATAPELRPRGSTLAIEVAGGASSERFFARPRRSSARSGVPLSKLGIPLFSPSVGAKTSGAGGATESAAGSGEQEAYLIRLQRRIDSFLTWPAELVGAGIDGNVDAELAFDEDGRYLGQLSRFEGSSPYLRLVVLRAVRDALREPLAPKRGGALRRARCSFRFEFRESAAAARESGGSWHVGETLAFQRSVVKSSLAWKAGPFAGILGVPALSVNPLWFVEKAKDLFSKRAKIDPLEKYRDDPEW